MPTSSFSVAHSMRRASGKNALTVSPFSLSSSTNRTGLHFRLPTDILLSFSLSLTLFSTFFQSSNIFSVIVSLFLFPINFFHLQHLILLFSVSYVHQKDLSLCLLSSLLQCSYLFIELAQISKGNFCIGTVSFVIYFHTSNSFFHIFCCVFSNTLKKFLFNLK